MFTGIIEQVGKIKKLTSESKNLHIEVLSGLASELKIDQSVSHNGVCLTVVDINEESYVVTAIDETLQKTNLSNLKEGDWVNLERAMKLGDRLDGHIVQGHVDQTGVCKSIEEVDGSWVFTFTYEGNKHNVTIEKGSITINGVSLTVVNSKENEFSVAIIPYTYNNTNFKALEKGSIVNLEFDVVGKYVKRLTQGYR
ncbi:riboflavin synthase [Marixanthomonas sp. SCSIO 43207]|uniref:riboflavin synthase n=1 Tax=Marixanthomonas sp. SCSIO 43207 TaxID=2779360 RepID=UPI001CA9FDB8|nr:riboflavin synthase [Marixanthomonas sp. SCSIO 43207]UAB81972.1 riboflavin synthase [Marixanthomonas sp. SCSIO 43207]